MRHGEATSLNSVVVSALGAGRAAAHVRPADAPGRPRPWWTFGSALAGVVVVLALMENAVAHEGDAPQGPVDAEAGLEVVLVSSELVLGANRFALGLFDGEGRHIQEARVHLHYYDVRDPAAPRLESAADATSLSTPDGFTTIYTHERTFAWAGAWGVEVQADLPGDRRVVKRIAFEVVPRGRALAPGEQVPRLRSPTISDVGGDLRLLSSASAPNTELYRVSLDESVQSGRPTVLLFATPGFCRTRFCGPSYQVVSTLQERYGEAANFIHIEIFAGLPNPAEHDWQLAPAVTAFGLTTEPWLYLVDQDGTVTHRVEGIFGEREVERHLLPLLGR